MLGGGRHQALDRLLSRPPHDSSTPPGQEIKTRTYYGILKELGIKGK
jgi:hypothetical protein